MANWLDDQYSANGIQMLNKSLFLILSIFCGFIAGCAPKESEVIKTAKCLKVGVELQDKVLEEASQRKVSSLVVAGSMGTRDAMEIHEEVKNQLGYNDSAKYVRTLREWQESDYCQALVKDLEKEVEQEMQALLKPVSPAEEGSCQVFSKQVSSHRTAGYEKYAKDLSGAISESLQVAVKENLKPYQSKVLLDPKFKGFSILVSEVDRQCTQGASSVVAALMSVPDLQNLPSPTTMQLLQEQSQAVSSGLCGEHQDYFCEATLRRTAIEQALRESKRCDGTMPSSQECEATAQELIEGHLNQLKIASLEKHRQKALEVLQDSKRLLSEIDIPSEHVLVYRQCEQHARRDGLRGDELFRYRQTECMAQVETARKNLVQKRLDAIDAILDEIRSRGI